MKIGVDIDDVIYPWADRAHALCEEAGITGGNTWTCWSPWLDYGCSKDEWLGVLSRATLTGRLYHQPPIEGSAAALGRLIDAGHTVHLVTARGQFVHGPIIMADTVVWLREHDMPYTTLTFSKDKTVVPTDWFAEDNLDNHDALVASGSKAVLINRPHNQPGLTADGQRRYCHRRRVNHIAEFVDLVLGVTP